MERAEDSYPAEVIDLTQSEDVSLFESTSGVRAKGLITGNG
jgi:hypothetical protein